MKQKIIIAGLLACLLYPVAAQRVVKLAATPPDEKFSVSITKSEPYWYDYQQDAIVAGPTITLIANAKGGGGYNYRPILFQNKGIDSASDIEYYTPTASFVNSYNNLSNLWRTEYSWTTNSPELIQEDSDAHDRVITIAQPASQATFTVNATNASFNNSAEASITIWPISVEGEAVDQKLEALYYPASKQLELKSEDLSLYGKKLTLAVFNSAGIPMYQSTQAVDATPFSATINLQHLQAGVYFLSVQHNSGRFSYSFIVK